MKKITELTETMMRPVYRRDEYGNRHRFEEEYTYLRPVQSADTGIRFAHMFLDSIGVQVFIKISYLIFKAICPARLLAMDYVLLSIILLILALMHVPIYYIFTEYQWQRTPAKYLTKTLVIDEYGNRPDLRSILARTAIRFVPFDLLSFLGGEPGWHDRWAGTWVVSEKELARLRELQAEQSDRNPESA